MQLSARASVAAIALAAVCASCGTASTAPKLHPSRVGAHTSTPTTSATSSSLSIGSATLERTAEVGPLIPDAAGDIAWPEGAGNWNQVFLWRSGSSAPAAVAHSEWPDGFINWVALAGSWVGYVDQSAMQGDGHMDVTWKIHAVDRDTGKNVVLATSPRPNPWVPTVRGGAGGLVWATAAPSGRADLWRWVPGSPPDEVDKVLSDSEMTPDVLTPMEDGIVYLGPNGLGVSGHTKGGDCWIAPYDGSAPRVLTHTALAESCAVSGSTLVYSLHIDPKAPTTNLADMSDDPYEVWTEPLSGAGKPHRLEQGYLAARPDVGATFVSWVDRDGRTVSATDGSSRRVVADADHTGYMTGAGGDILAWARLHPDRHMTVKILTIQTHE